MSDSAAVIGPVLGQILETMYFCEAVYHGDTPVDAPAIAAALTFAGTTTGEFRVCISESLARQLAADFLVTDLPEVTALQMDGTVQELANIACGATLKAWMPDGAFHCGLPRRIDPASEATAKLRRAFHHSFSVTGDGAELAVEVAVQD